MGITWEECLRAEGRENAKLTWWGPAGSILRRVRSLGEIVAGWGTGRVAGTLIIIRTLLFLGYCTGVT